MAGVEEEAVELFNSVKVSPDSPCARLRSSKFSVSKFKLLTLVLEGVEEEVADRVEPVKLRHQPKRVLLKALGASAGARAVQAGARASVGARAVGDTSVNPRRSVLRWT